MEKREEIQKLSTEKIIEEDFQGAYVIAPRVGKSKIVADALKGANVWPEDVHIAVPRERILDSWHDELLKWGFYDYSEKKEKLLPNLLCFLSLKKIPEGVEYLVIDEFHMLSVAQMQMIRKKKPKRLLLISGTANAYTRGSIRYYLGMEVKYEYTIEEAIKDGIIANFHVYVVQTELDNIVHYKEVKTSKYHFVTTEKKMYDFHDNMFEDLRMKARANYDLEKVKMRHASKRSDVLYNSLNKERVAKKIIAGMEERERILIFTARTDMADKLSPYSYHTKNKKEDNLNKFMEGEINKLAVVHMSDMGVTIEDLKFEVVQQLQSSSEASLQKFLRAANLEEDREARIVIVVCKDTVDEGWCRSALEGVPEQRITRIREEELDKWIEKGFMDTQTGTSGESTLNWLSPNNSE